MRLRVYLDFSPSSDRHVCAGQNHPTSHGMLKVVAFNTSVYISLRLSHPGFRRYCSPKAGKAARHKLLRCYRRVLKPRALVVDRAWERDLASGHASRLRSAPWLKSAKGPSIFQSAQASAVLYNRSGPKCCEGAKIQRALLEPGLETPGNP